IGYGHTGSAFAARLIGFGVKVLAHDKYKDISIIAPSHVQAASLEEIQAGADIISLHLPLNPETRADLDITFINAWAKPFFLLNTARGGVVDTACLAGALKRGKLRGVALDVMENERLKNYTAPEWARLHELLDAGNVIVTPHIAGWTQEARRNIFM